jgi:hypothetical protein
MAKIKTSLMLSVVARKLLIKLAQKLGLSQSASLELAIRWFAKEENIFLDE